jgi:hypothetical protein
MGLQVLDPLGTRFEVGDEAVLVQHLHQLGLGFLDELVIVGLRRAHVRVQELFKHYYYTHPSTSSYNSHHPTSHSTTSSTTPAPCTPKAPIICKMHGLNYKNQVTRWLF